MRQHKDISVSEVAKIFAQYGNALVHSGKSVTERLNSYWDFSFRLTDTFFEATKKTVTDDVMHGSDQLYSHTDHKAYKKYTIESCVLKIGLDDSPFIIQLYKEGRIDCTISNFIDVYGFVYENMYEISSCQGVYAKDVYTFLSYLSRSTYIHMNQNVSGVNNIVIISNMHEVKNRKADMYKEIVGDFDNILFSNSWAIAARSDMKNEIVDVLERYGVLYYELVESTVVYIRSSYAMFYVDGNKVKADIELDVPESIMDGFIPYMRMGKLKNIFGAKDYIKDRIHA